MASSRFRLYQSREQAQRGSQVVRFFCLVCIVLLVSKRRYQDTKEWDERALAIR